MATAAERMRKYRSNPQNLAKQRKAELERREATPRYSLNLALHNARKRTSDVTLTADDLVAIWREQQGKCALTGIAMTWSKGKILPASLSVDRIDQSVGYVAGNVRLVCYAVNCFRGRMSDDEMFTMAIALIGNMKRPKLKLVS